MACFHQTRWSGGIKETCFGGPYLKLQGPWQPLVNNLNFCRTSFPRNHLVQNIINTFPFLQSCSQTAPLLQSREKLNRRLVKRDFCLCGSIGILHFAFQLNKFMEPGNIELTLKITQGNANSWPNILSHGAASAHITFEYYSEEQLDHSCSYCHHSWLYSYGEKM